MSVGDDIALPAVLEASEYHRVLPTVLARLPDTIALKIPQSIRERLTLDAARMMTLRHAGKQLLAAFAEAEVPAVIVKGEDFAAKLYSPPIWRPYTDIDVLIEKIRMPDARRVLRKLGYVRGGSLVKHDDGYAEDKWARNQGGLQLPVELHWDLINSPSLRAGRHLAYGDVVASDGKVDSIGDLLIACVHGALGHTFERLYHLVDILQSARRLSGAVDPCELGTRAQNCGLRGVVAMSLTIAGGTFKEEACFELLNRSGLPAPPHWAVRLLDIPTLMKERGSLDPSIAWRRPLVRQWLKHNAANRI